MKEETKGKAKKKEEKETQKTREELSLGLFFVAFIFLVRGLYLLYASFEEFAIVPGGLFGKLLVVGGFLLAAFYLLSSVAVLSRKRFGLYLGSTIMFFDIFFSIALISNAPMMIGLNVLFMIFLLYLLRRNERYFRGVEKADKLILAVCLMIALAYFGSLYYVGKMPSEEEHYQIISKEAREKGDWKVCEKLSWGRERCKASVIAIKKDPELCKIVQSVNVRFDCYVDVAQALNNKSVCDLMDEEIIKDGLRFNEDRIDECKGLV